MCKVAGIYGYKKEAIDSVWPFMETLGQYMSQSNRDGLGYASIDRQGNLFGERWLYNNAAFKEPQDNAKVLRIYESIKDIVEPIDDYNAFGGVNREDSKAIILHTRAATCSKGLVNTHPFVEPGMNTAIIHNGIIYNDKVLTKKYSTCDSEVILHQYLNMGVNLNITRVPEFTDSLSGWMAVMALSRGADDSPILDILTDGTKLHMTYIEELGAVLYTTDAADIVQVCDDYDFNPGKIGKVKAGSFIRINLDSGKVADVAKFNADKAATGSWTGFSNFGYGD